MRTLVKSGRIVTATVQAQADLLCQDGRIAAWYEPGRSSATDVDEVVDATGMVILPGLIDPHVHSRDPGQTDKETFEASTRAAAASGITTLLEMPNAVPPVIDGATFHDRVEHLAARAHVDFGLWGMALDGSSREAIGEFRAAGAVAVKVFWGFAFDRREQRLVYSFPDDAGDRYIQPASPAGLLDVLEEAARHDVLVGVHCEDRSLIEVGQARHGGYLDYAGLNRCRPVAAEALSVAMVAELAETTGARVHVLHLSSAQAIDAVEAAQRRGIKITAETCPHYLALSEDDFDRVGPAMKVYPPVRQAADREALCRAIRRGSICSVGSDHAPHAEQERIGPLHAQPAGARGIHAMVPVLLDAAHRGEVRLEQVADCLSESTARLYGLHPRKGLLLPGADADLTIVDMTSRWRLDDMAGANFPLTDPWRDRRGVGRAVASLLRGRILMRNGDVVQELGGQFVPSRGVGTVGQTSRPRNSPGPSAANRQEGVGGQLGRAEG